VNQDEAKIIFGSFSKEFQKYGQIEIIKIEQYWKNKEQFEILFNLVPEKEVINTISNVTESLSSEWEIFSNSYVWNYSDKGYLVDKRVKWANVEMIEV
jgi:hypothetical protein